MKCPGLNFIYLGNSILPRITKHPKVKLRDSFPLNKHSVTERSVRKDMHSLAKSTYPDIIPSVAVRVKRQLDSEWLHVGDLWYSCLLPSQQMLVSAIFSNSFTV